MPALQTTNLPVLSNEGFNQPLRIRKGSTFRPTITVTDTEGAVFSLVGYTVRASLRLISNRSTKVDFTFIATDLVNGECELELLPAITNALVSGDAALNKATYTWDCDLVETASGSVTPFCHGPVTIAEGDTSAIV